MDKQEFLKKVGTDFFVFMGHWNSCYTQYEKSKREFENIEYDYHISQEEKMAKLIEVNKFYGEHQYFWGMTFYQKKLLEAHGEGDWAEAIRALNASSDEELEQYREELKKILDRVCRVCHSQERICP